MMKISLTFIYIENIFYTIFYGLSIAFKKKIPWRNKVTAAYGKDFYLGGIARRKGCGFLMVGTSKNVFFTGEEDKKNGNKM